MCGATIPNLTLITIHALATIPFSEQLNDEKVESIPLKL